MGYGNESSVQEWSVVGYGNECSVQEWLVVGYGNECSVQECGQWWDMVMKVVYKSVVSRGLW